jgi:hypothetical protein
MYQQAASTASSAATGNASYRPLASDMQYLVSLPPTGNSSATVAKAHTSEQDMDARCRSLGVQL